MIPDLKVRLPRCVRCRGKMILDKATRDATCFTCGGILYALEPDRGPSRPISHGGQRLN